MSGFGETDFDRKKEAICYAAAQIFAEKSFEKTTLEEISAGMEMTKAALYHYFSGKEDILFHCLFLAHSMANEALSKIVENKGLPPREKLRLTIREHVRVLTRKFVYATLRQQDLLLPQKLRNEILEMRKKFQHMFVGIVQEGVERQSFKVDNLKMVSFAILGMVNWVARWYSPDGPFGPEEISDAFCTLIFHGLEK